MVLLVALISPVSAGDPVTKDDSEGGVGAGCVWGSSVPHLLQPAFYNLVCAPGFGVMDAKNTPSDIAGPCPGRSPRNLSEGRGAFRGLHPRLGAESLEEGPPLAGGIRESETVLQLSFDK